MRVWLCARHGSWTARVGGRSAADQYRSVRAVGESGQSAPRPRTPSPSGTSRSRAAPISPSTAMRWPMTPATVVLRPASLLVLEPLQPYRGVPLRTADVTEQRVEPRGLRVVRSGPVRHRDVGRAAAQTGVDHPGPQRRVEIQAAVGVQQPDRVPQPQGLVRAGGALGQMRLDGLGLLRRAGRQGPRAEERPEDAVRRHRRVRRGRWVRWGRWCHGGFRFRCCRPRGRARLLGRARGDGRRQGYGGEVEVVRGGPGSRYARCAPDLVVVSAVAAAVRLVVGHRGRPYPGGDIPSSGRVCAVESSCSPRRSRRRASSSVTPRSAAVCR